MLDTFDLPEGDITYDNYDMRFEALNNTMDTMGVIQTNETMGLAWCDLESILSQVTNKDKSI